MPPPQAFCQPGPPPSAFFHHSSPYWGWMQYTGTTAAGFQATRARFSGYWLCITRCAGGSGMEEWYQTGCHPWLYLPVFLEDSVGFVGTERSTGSWVLCSLNAERYWVWWMMPRPETHSWLTLQHVMGANWSFHLAFVLSKHSLLKCYIFIWFLLSDCYRDIKIPKNRFYVEWIQDCHILVLCGHLPRPVCKWRPLGYRSTEVLCPVQKYGVFYIPDVYVVYFQLTTMPHAPGIKPTPIYPRYWFYSAFCVWKGKPAYFCLLWNRNPMEITIV